MTELVFPIFLCMIFLCLTWFMQCNDTTLADRNRIRVIARRYIGDPQRRFWKVYEGLNDVTYERHLWHRITFRDPFKLYPPIIRENVK